MIEIINTGGTFNKRYNPITGKLEVSNKCEAVQDIFKRALFLNQKFKITQIISKDSLDFTERDRELLLESIKSSSSERIVVIHGTDTMNRSAQFIAEFIKDKVVIFTGAMKPYEIDSVEATANFMLAIGFLQNAEKGVYISMHGIVEKFDKIAKNYKEGVFYVT